MTLPKFFHRKWNNGHQTNSQNYAFFKLMIYWEICESFLVAFRNYINFCWEEIVSLCRLHSTVLILVGLKHFLNKIRSVSHFVFRQSSNKKVAKYSGFTLPIVYIVFLHFVFHIGTSWTVSGKRWNFQVRFSTENKSSAR